MGGSRQKLLFICNECGKIIHAYKNSTNSRRKCASCGSYDISPYNEVKNLQDSAVVSPRSHSVFLQDCDNGLSEVSSPLVSFVIVDFNGYEVLQNLLQDLFSLSYQNIEIIIVDNGNENKPDTFATFLSDSRVRYVKNDENNYCMANNKGYALSSGDIVCFVNNDVRLPKDFVSPILERFKQVSAIGAVGPKVLNTTGTIASAGLFFRQDYRWRDRGVFAPSDEYNIAEQVDALNGCCIFFARRALEDIGVYDERYQMYMDDVDMALRLWQRQWRIFYEPDSVITHIGGFTSQKIPGLAHTMVERNRILLVAKHFPEKIGYVLTTVFNHDIKGDMRTIYEIMPEVIDTLHSHQSEDVLRDAFYSFIHLVSLNHDIFVIDRANDLKREKMLQTEVAHLKNQLAKGITHEEYQKLENDFSFYREQKDSDIADLIKLKDQLSSELEVLRSDLHSAEHKIGEISSASSKKDIQIDQLSLLKNNLSEENSMLKHKVEDLERQIIENDAVLFEKISSLQEENERSHKKIIDLGTLYDELQRMYAKKKDEHVQDIGYLRSQLDESSIAFDMYKQQIDEKALLLEKKNEELEREIQNLHCYSHDLNEEKRQMLQKIDKLKSILSNQRELLRFFKHSRVCMAVYRLNEYLSEEGE